jgi:sugar phosphate isomerase/epimerase
MKFSMGSWSFAFGPCAAVPKSLEQVVERLAQAGFDGIELSGFPPHATLERYASPTSRSALRSLIEDHGLGISGYSSDLGAFSPIIPANAASYLDEFTRQVEFCHDIGSPMIRIDSGAAPGTIPDSDYSAALHRLAELWRRCADHARQAGVVMAWEFEPGFIFNKPSEIAELHHLIGHPWFRVLFDTAHAYMCAVVGARQHAPHEVLPGGVTELIERLHGAIGAVHVVDSDGTLFADDTSTHVPLGQGLIGWPAITPKLLSLPRIEWWCVDLSFCAQSWDFVDDSLRAARALLNQNRT